MISVGIDISKGKSMICIWKPYGEVIRKTFEISPTEKDLLKLTSMIKELDDEVRVIMEATGNYHLPVLSFLKEQEVLVSVINPLVMKKYVSTVLRTTVLIGVITVMGSINVHANDCGKTKDDTTTSSSSGTTDYYHLGLG